MAAPLLAAAAAGASMAHPPSPPSPPPPLPVLFLAHGGGPSYLMVTPPGHPMHEMDSTSRSAQFLRGLSAHAQLAPHWPRVRSVLVVSAHWEEAAAFTVMEADSPPLLYDYGGFPPETYNVHWPASGSPALAARVRAALAGAGLPAAGDGGARGFDHGVFVPLKLVLPAAQLPTIQLSLHASLDPALHLRAGAALAALREEGVLIVASGFATHNLRATFGSRLAAGQDAAWLLEFDAWLADTVVSTPPEERVRRLAQLERAPSFRMAHPREEHLMPILVAVGAAAPEAVAAVLGGAGGQCTSAAAVVATDGAASAAAAPPRRSSSQLFAQHVGGTMSLASFIMQ